MNINFLTQKSIYSFKGATVNVNAFSDIHGELALANCALEEMKNNKSDIFCPNVRGKKNVLAICGDWYMDGGRTGYKSAPDKPLQYFQHNMLNAFINQINNISKGNITLFTPGNHEFDGGVPLLDDVLSTLKAKIIMTNLKVDKSPALKKTIEHNKPLNQFILEVEDDKNPFLKHKVLFLGIIPVNMLSYQKKLNGIELIENMNTLQANVKKEDYTKTLNDCKERIKKFKEENPKGLVVLMSHTGVEFADNLAKEAPVNLVFDGHEHKDKLRTSNGVPIVPLSKNFEKIVNAKLEINDEGNLKDIKLKYLHPKKSNSKGVLTDLYKKMFKADFEKNYTIKCDNEKIKELNLSNFLSNFVTDCVLEELRKKDDTIDFFALNTSAIRHPLKVGDKKCVSNLDVMSVLAGIKEEDGKIVTTELPGDCLLYMILDNVIPNHYMPEKNRITHYSGLKIDRIWLIKAYELGANIDELCSYIKDARTNEPIKTDRMYKIANVEKYFQKSKNPYIRAILNISQSREESVQSLFKQHFETSSSTLCAKCDKRI